MAKYSNTVEYNIRTTLDNSGIAKLQSELVQLQNRVNTLGAKGLIPESSMQKTLADIKVVQTALQQAFNPKLGMLNASKFMSSLKAQGASLNSIYQSFNNAGAAGQRAFTSMYGQIAKIDTGMRSVSKTTDKIFNTMGNTFRWGIIASGFAGMMNSIHEAAEYTKDLDKSLTNIMMVSGETRDNMNEYARTANEVAQKLGSTTVAMTDATQVFIQQGYDLQKSQELATYSTVLANVSQQDTQTASDEITAYMNAYQIPLEDIGNALSKWAEVANVSAADVEELSVASQKAASVATTVGVDMDQLAATIATIETVTREAPENIGNGLKTIYSRLSDVKLGETLEDGVDLGQITSQLNKVGVQVLDEAGQMRDVGVIVEDLMDVWQTLSQTEKAATATTLAGRFQLARFEALMNRSDLYKEYLSSSRSQTGTETLDFMQETYEQSLEGRLNALQAKVEEVFLNIFESSSFNGAIDSLSGLVDVLNELIKATGGGETALLGLSTVLINLASTSLSRGISNIITNRQADLAGQRNLETQQQLARAQLQGQGLNTGNTEIDKFANDIAKINQYGTSLNEEQQQTLNNLIKDRVQILNDLSSATERQTNAEQVLRIAMQEMGDTGKMTKDELIALAEQFQMMSEEELLQSDGFKRFRSEVNLTTQSFNKLIDILEKGETSTLVIGESAEKLSSDLKKLSTSGILTEEQITKLNVTLKQLKGVIQGDEEAIRKLSSTELTKMAQALNLSDEQLVKLIQHFNQARGEVAAMSAANEVAAGSFEHMAHGVELQNTANQIIGLASGIGQLAFAWQSFNNLGSIWTREDLDFGEKLLDTIINISFALPMLITGFQQTKTGLAAIIPLKDVYLKQLHSEITLRDQAIVKNVLSNETISEEVKKQYLVTLAKQKGIKTTEEMTAAEIGEQFSRTGNVLAINLETKALEMLNKAKAFASANKLFLGTAAALAVLAAAFGIYNQEIENAKQRTQEQIDTVKEFSKTSEQYKSYKDLYDRYIETGEGADQLADSAKQLGESLGIAGASALAESKNFIALNQQIEKSIETHERYAKIAAKSALVGLENEINTHNAFDANSGLGYKYLIDEITSPSDWGTGNRFEQATGFSVDALGNFNDGLKVEERIGKINQLLEEQAEKVEQLEIKQSKLQKSSLEWEAISNELDYEKKLLADLEHFSQEDAFKNAQDLLETNANNALANLNYSNLNNSFNIKNIKEQLLEDNEDIAKYIQTLSPELGEAYLNGVLEYLMSQLGDSKLKSVLEEYFKENIPVDIDSSLFSYDKEKIKTILEDAGLDEAQLDNYVKEFSKTGGGTIDYSDQIKTLNEFIKTGEKEQVNIDNRRASLIRLRDEYENQGKSTKELDKKLISLNKDYDYQKKATETAQTQLQDLAIASLQTDNALDKLAEKWEELSTSLESGNIGEQSQAMGELKQIVADMLNVDASILPDDFVTQHLEDIRGIAEGDATLINNLRADIGSDPIIVHVGTEAGLAANEIEQLKGYVHQAQEALPTLEVGAYLDDEQFLLGLSNLVNGSAEAATQVAQIFEGLGYDVIWQDNIRHFDSFKAAVQGGATLMGAATGGIGTALSMANAGVTWQKTDGIDVNIPSFTMVKKGGNAGGSGYKGKTGGSGGGGGGGGGGGKSYEPKTKDPIEEEIDRYEKVQTALDEVDSQINKLTVDQDRLMGNNWIENLEKETGLLQEQIPLYEEKLRIQKEEQQELQKQLADNYGARFNDIGLLQNYAEIHKRLEKEVNDLINRYNSTTTEEGQNALEKQIESAQERLEKFKKQYQRYDTLVSKDMIDTQKALEEIQNRLEDIRYEAYKARKEAAEQLKDLRDDRREFNESIATLFNDDSSLSLRNAMSRFKDLFQADEKYVADAITMYKKKLSQATSEDMKKFYQAQIDSLKKAQSNGTSVLDLNFQRLNEVMAEYDKWLAGGQTSWSEADLWEAMQDAFDDAVDLAKELKDQVDDIHDKIADVIDEMDEATERRKDAFESINDELEYMRDMSELLYGDQAYATQAQTYNLQAHNNEQLLKTLEAAQKANQKILEATKDNAAAQEEYQAALEKEKELQGEILDTRKEIAEAYKDAKEAANNLAVQNWLDQFQGEIDGVKVPLKYAQEAWERINENADLYLDELNRAWETEKLQNKYLELINNNTDPTIQKQITDQMNQQLGYLRDKTNLSKYDVEYANAQLEILQKTIALEDARANKNQMRLRRDTQGNYSYVYAASQADIASAENDLLDAQMNGYNISVEANRNSADSFYQKIQAMADQLRDAANDATLSEEQIAAITADIIKDGYEYLDAMGEQLTTAQKNMIESFIQAAQNLGAENSQAVQIIADELINNVDATVETISDKFVSGVERMIGPDGLALFREEAEQTRDDIVQNVHDFETAIGDANVNIQTPLTDIDTNLQHTTTSMSELADEAQRFYDIMNNNTGVILQAAGELAEYQAKLTDAENELSVYSEKVNKLGQDLETQKTINTQLNATNSDLQRQLEQAKKDAENARNGGGSGSGGGSGGSLTRNRVGEIFYLIHYGQVGNEGDRTPNLRNRGYSDREIRAGQKAINLAYLNDYDNEDAISWAAAHMKTGGYTGTWSGANTDNNGKLAVLHQKELVLNAADTENILSAVDIIRKIVAALKGNISGGLLTNMISSIGQIGGDTIEQRVEIKAEFPNATSAREIEEAFNTIANTSYQYAYNKNSRTI